MVMMMMMIHHHILLVVVALIYHVNLCLAGPRTTKSLREPTSVVHPLPTLMTGGHGVDGGVGPGQRVLHIHHRNIQRSCVGPGAGDPCLSDNLSVPLIRRRKASGK
jgi:hypothetical protein